MTTAYTRPIEMAMTTKKSDGDAQQRLLNGSSIFAHFDIMCAV